MKAKTAIFTSCAANYIPKARVLAESLKKHHQPDELDVYLLLTDDIPDAFSLEKEAYDEVVTSASLGIADFERWMFGHRIVEACTAVKPFMLKHLLEKGYEQVIYFDPDIAVFNRIDVIVDAFSKGSILLTPHINEEEKTLEAIKDNELNSLKHGLYNFGFVGVKNTQQGRDYADWWAKRCYFRCFDDIAGGNFTDQKWNDLVPIFFDEAYMLKHSGCNVATWNYAQRKLEGSLEQGITANGEPLIFHHFTGFDSGAHILMRDKYGAAMPAALELSKWYVDSCKHYAEEKLEAVPWRYGHYENGVKIEPHHRTLYRSREDLRDAFTHPFAVEKEGKYNTSYHDWLHAQGFWETAPVSEPTRSFRDFMQSTRYEFDGYIHRTHRLKQWQKSLLLKCSGLIFGGLKKAA